VKLNVTNVLTLLCAAKLCVPTRGLWCLQEPLYQGAPMWISNTLISFSGLYEASKRNHNDGYRLSRSSWILIVITQKWDCWILIIEVASGVVLPSSWWCRIQGPRLKHTNIKIHQISGIRVWQKTQKHFDTFPHQNYVWNAEVWFDIGFGTMSNKGEIWVLCLVNLTPPYGTPPKKNKGLTAGLLKGGFPMV